MSDGEGRNVSVQDIQLVQNLIERCLQLYMSQGEVMSTLLHHAKIEPGFTELVWQKLETENKEFFRAYHLRLLVKDQIIRFNQLLERQFEMMQQVCHNGASSIPPSNGSQTHPLLNNSYVAPFSTMPSIKQEIMHQDTRSMPNAYTNGASTLHSHMQVATNMGVHAVRPENILMPQSSSTGMTHGMNGGIIKSESGYTGESAFIFGAENNLLEPRNAIGEASVSTFSGAESTSQALNEPILEPEINSFGFLGQIPRNFSLSDLTADFTNSTDILDSYSRSPFMGTETDANFLDPQTGREHQANARRMGSISEGLSYEDFGSD